MRQAVRAIVIKDNHLLVMHRNKFGKQYLTLPGGGVKPGESLAQALLRELSEETGVSVSNPRLVFIDHAGEPYGDQHVFLCEYQAGDPALRADSEEAGLNKLQQNIHTPGWLPLDNLSTQAFRSDKLKAHILTALKQDWPMVPENF